MSHKWTKQTLGWYSLGDHKLPTRHLPYDSPSFEGWKTNESRHYGYKKKSLDFRCEGTNQQLHANFLRQSQFCDVGFLRIEPPKESKSSDYIQNWIIFIITVLI
jgi:hypothetical protein